MLVSIPAGPDLQAKSLKSCTLQLGPDCYLRFPHTHCASVSSCALWVEAPLPVLGHGNTQRVSPFLMDRPPLSLGGHDVCCVSRVAIVQGWWWLQI